MLDFSNKEGTTFVETNDLLDCIGSLISQLKTFSSKVPAIVPTASVSGGLRPKQEAVELFEDTIGRFREQAKEHRYRPLIDLMVESLEAFESGWILKAVQSQLKLLDHVELMQGETTLVVTPADETRLKEYRHTLNKILPGNEPELQGAGRGL